MKLINSAKNETHEISALGVICGRRGDSVELNEKDLTDLLGLSSMQLHERLTQIRVRVKQTDMLNKAIKDRLNRKQEPTVAIFSRFAQQVDAGKKAILARFK